MRILLVFASLALASPQGLPCDPGRPCAAPYQCVVTGSGRPSCQQLCSPDHKGKQNGCPDDQRCVKDGARHVCRPITDHVGM